MRACRSADSGTVIRFGEITFMASIPRLAWKTRRPLYPSSRRISTQSDKGHPSVPVWR
jgi:hypothetical protein